MTIQNKIQDTLIRIKNAQNTQKNTCLVTKSKIIENILCVLYKEGYINGFFSQNKNIIIYLKYNTKNQPAIKKLNLKSKPGIQEYITTKKLKFYEKKNNNLSILILSTPKGILSQNDALKKNVGGKVLCEIY